MTTQTPTQPAPSTPILAIDNLIVRYGAGGGIEALHGISLTVEQNQIVTLIGANGAGKSSLLRAISNLIPTSKGTITYSPQERIKTTEDTENTEIPSEISNLKSVPSSSSVLSVSSVVNPVQRSYQLHRTPAHKIVALGLSHVPEGRGIFPDMSVQENLDLGAYLRHDHHQITADLHRVFTLFPRIKERRTQLAGTMSGGEQQMLAIARALMSRPKMLLLDEPSLGLAPLLVEQIFSIIREINQQGVTILLVEQNAHMALQLAHYAYVLETGTIPLHGPAKDIQGNDQVRKAYLGA